jgi:hypothetical protein
MAFAIS